MSVAHLIVTVVTALWVGFSAYALAARLGFVVEPLRAYGVPESWWPWLATAKAAGSVGLLLGLLLPPLGVAASVGLIGYFLGAEITVLRARAYSHIPAPLSYLLLAIAGLVLGLLVD